MEKYSNFKDPVTGINPFLQPRMKPLTISMILLATLKAPIYLLFLCGVPVIGLLIKINRKDTLQPEGLISCNSVCEFDREIIKRVFRIDRFGIFGYKTCVYFPEKANSNNMAILNFKEEECSEYSIGLRYSSECIYLYGNRFMWLLRFLGSFNTVDIRVVKGANLEMATGLPRVLFDFKDRRKFLELISRK